MSRPIKDVKRVVLAYSGGLDTSIILKWLQTTYGCEVVTFTADLGQGEGSRCEGSQQVDVERLERKSFTVEGSTRRSSTRLPRRTSAAGRTCVSISGWIPKSSCVSSCWQGRRHRAARGVHQVRSRHVLSSLRQMQGQVFVGAEAQVAESTICVVSCVPHRHACVARACELGLSAR
jgi:hypothetical protein